MDGLIIKKKWIDLFECGKKSFEIRSMSCKSHLNQRVAILESKSHLIRGTCLVHHCFKTTMEEFKEDFDLHHVSMDELKKFNYKKIWYWELCNFSWLHKPKPYKHPQGAVIWVKNVYDDETLKTNIK